MVPQRTYGQQCTLWRWWSYITLLHCLQRQKSLAACPCGRVPGCHALVVAVCLPCGLPGCHACPVATCLWPVRHHRTAHAASGPPLQSCSRAAGTWLPSAGPCCGRCAGTPAAAGRAGRAGHDLRVNTNNNSNRRPLTPKSYSLHSSNQ